MKRSSQLQRSRMTGKGRPKPFKLRTARGCDACPVWMLRSSDAWRDGKRVLCSTCVYPFVSSSARPRRLKPVSAKRRRDLVTRTALLLGLKDAVGHRCEFCRDAKCWPLDGHEVRKPRSLFWLDPEFVCILGRKHHEMAEAAYSSPTGRLVIPGTRSTGWGFRVVKAANKQAARAAGVA